MPREWLLLQNSLNLSTQPIEAAAHIGHAGSEPDPGSCGKMDHLRKLSRTQRTTAGSAPFSTLIIARPGNSICIAPPLDVCTSAVASVVAGFISESAVTVTGSSAVEIATPSLN